MEVHWSNSAAKCSGVCLPHRSSVAMLGSASKRRRSSTIAGRLRRMATKRAVSPDGLRSVLTSIPRAEPSERRAWTAGISPWLTRWERRKPSSVLLLLEV